MSLARSAELLCFSPRNLAHQVAKFLATCQELATRRLFDNPTPLVGKFAKVTLALLRRDGLRTG